MLSFESFLCLEMWKKILHNLTVIFFDAILTFLDVSQWDLLSFFDNFLYFLIHIMYICLKFFPWKWMNSLVANSLQPTAFRTLQKTEPYEVCDLSHAYCHLGVLKGYTCNCMPETARTDTDSQVFLKIARFWKTHKKSKKVWSGTQ